MCHRKSPYFIHTREILFPGVKHKGGNLPLFFLYNLFLSLCLESYLPKQLCISLFSDLCLLSLSETDLLLFIWKDSLPLPLLSVPSPSFVLPRGSYSHLTQAYFLFMVSAPLGHKLHKNRCLSVWFMAVLLYQLQVWPLLNKWVNFLIFSVFGGNVCYRVPCIKLEVLLIPINSSRTIYILLEFLNKNQQQ